MRNSRRWQLLLHFLCSKYTISNDMSPFMLLVCILILTYYSRPHSYRRSCHGAFLGRWSLIIWEKTPLKGANATFYTTRCLLSLPRLLTRRIQMWPWHINTTSFYPEAPFGALMLPHLCIFFAVRGNMKSSSLYDIKFAITNDRAPLGTFVWFLALVCNLAYCLNNTTESVGLINVSVNVRRSIQTLLSSMNAFIDLVCNRIPIYRH